MIGDEPSTVAASLARLRLSAGRGAIFVLASMPADPAAQSSPFDQYAWDGTVDPVQPLTQFQESLIASALPAGAQVLEVRPHRRWDDRLTYPVYVRVSSSSGEATVLVRMERFRGGVETEAAILPILGRVDLPVPRLLAGPAVDPSHPDRGAASVLTVLPGKDMQQLSLGAGAAELEHLGGLLFQAVRLLHEATPMVRDDPAAEHIPTVSLADELRAIEVRGGPWLDDRQFRAAVARLLPAAAAEGERVPLVFSNGDYNAGNFLSDGERLTGIVDFARAGFEDPFYGFAKYWAYDMQPFLGTGVIARGLAAWGVTDEQFALRLAIRCLWTLQREVHVAEHEGGHGRYREDLRALLRRSVAASRDTPTRSRRS